MTISFPAANEPIVPIRTKRPMTELFALTERSPSLHRLHAFPVPPAQEAKSAFPETTVRKAAKRASPAPHGLPRVTNAHHPAMLHLIELPVPFVMITAQKTELAHHALPAPPEEDSAPRTPRNDSAPHADRPAREGYQGESGIRSSR